MEELGIILQNLDWSPLWISLKTGVVATFFCFFLGILAASSSIQMSNEVFVRISV